MARALDSMSGADVLDRKTKPGTSLERLVAPMQAGGVRGASAERPTKCCHVSVFAGCSVAGTCPPESPVASPQGALPPLRSQGEAADVRAPRRVRWMFPERDFGICLRTKGGTT